MRSVYTGKVPYGQAIKIPDFPPVSPGLTPGEETVSCLLINIVILSCTFISWFELDISPVHTLHSYNLTSS